MLLPMTNLTVMRMGESDADDEYEYGGIECDAIEYDGDAQWSH